QGYLGVRYVATRQCLSNLLVSKKTKRRFLWLPLKWPLMHRGERTITRSEERRVIVASSVGTVFDVSLAGSKFWNRGEVPRGPLRDEAKPPKREGNLWQQLMFQAKNYAVSSLPHPSAT